MLHAADVSAKINGGKMIYCHFFSESVVSKELCFNGWQAFEKIFQIKNNSYNVLQIKQNSYNILLLH